MRRNLTFVLSCFCLFVAAASACAPPEATYESGPGSFHFTLTKAGGTLGTGGGDVSFTLSDSVDHVAFGCPDPATSHWAGSMVTRSGFDGVAGIWKIDVAYNTGLFGGACGPFALRLVDPDGDVQVDTALTGPADAVGIQTLGSTQLQVVAPLVNDRSVMAQITLVIDVPGVNDTFADPDIP
jgi:hypothetical protein